MASQRMRAHPGRRGDGAAERPACVPRGGQTVARLKITQVEPSSSIADVVPGTMQRGQSVQPGDMVIFAGRQNMTAPPAEEATPAPPAGTGATTMTP